ncbi:hypothetical protein BH10ACT1_BH10ACT1_38460 [soil metagenome]
MGSDGGGRDAIQADVVSDPRPRISLAMILALITAGPYALAFGLLGLRTLGMETYPRVFGLRFSGDLRPEFPNGRAGVGISIVVILIGVGLVADLVGVAHGGWLAKWSAIAWLSLAIWVVWSMTRDPSEAQRCFLDGYSDQRVCASSASIERRNFAVFAAPAVVAIGALLMTRPTVRPPSWWWNTLTGYEPPTTDDPPYT